MADKTFLDWPFFDGAHRALAAGLDAWAETDMAPLVEAEHAAGHDDARLDAVCRDLVAALGAGGWLRACVPAEYGGAVPGRLDVRGLCISRETLSRRSGLADFAFAMQGLGTGPITLYGTDDQKARYLPPVVKGERIAAFALSEPQAGSDPAEMTTTATLDGDSYVLNGTKTWISNGGIADHYVVFARTGEAPGARGISAFIVEPDAPGFSVAERIPVIAPHPLATLSFADCRVPRANLVGAPGEGFKVAMATLDIFRSTVAAAALGFARRALDEALDRTRVRLIGGEPLAGYQMTQARIADMALRVDAAALLVYRAAWTKDVKGVRVSREASMAKLYATEAAQEVIDAAVQLHGGRGVVCGETVERLYREIRSLRIYEGTSEVQKLIIAGQTRATHDAG
ncbi:MAG: acyl-CoA dehydrogenase family protein [Hyphomicrobiales bacterium]|nr:acyl-CoA dehydrogenase family protein [Hyphomicrobiales bacterium]MCP5372977.1 acyl-CoA dehydrogenase family protein [Hyphomicrobiales bacterium]